jgi:aspartate/methionine/tyrosine aminotransferase
VTQFVDVQKYMRPGEKLEDLMSRCIDVCPPLLPSLRSSFPHKRTLQEGVLVAPGYISGQEFTHHIRICFTAVPLDQLTDALVRLQRALGIASA